ncbi:MAG TPA: 6-phospho-3-hexuloisomerase [Mesotoga infera]|uniref:6-phospho-3-hexuloisomerase n=1 Tax=Mesotoga infera TaxID=1236046 RepID=A0A7C1GU07_9BACT|nr:6-phospho-3-hexuloisomerase [Mesotoga infera]
MKFEGTLDVVIDEIRSVLSGVTDESIEELSGSILKARRVFLFAMGRSGLAIKAFAMRLMHLGLKVHVVGEVTSPSLGGGDLLIIGSASGETPSVVLNCKKARKFGAGIASITASSESTVAEVSDIVITIPTKTPKVPDRAGVSSVQPMGNLFEQSLLILTDIIVMNLMEKLSIDSEMMFKNHANLE